MTVLGVGHDVVDIPAFAALLDAPGSTLAHAFSTRELRQCHIRAIMKHDDWHTHLAVRWAGKESILKAWCEALGDRPYPYTLDTIDWSGIEILDDTRGCPHIVLAPRVLDSWRRSMVSVPSHDSASSHTNVVDRPVDWHISLSHDGDVASAVVVVQR